MDKEPASDHINRRAIYERVKKNHDTLDRCVDHSFSIDLTLSQKLDKKWRYDRCSGIATAEEKYWYERGRSHEKAKNQAIKQVSDLIPRPDESDIQTE